MQLVPHRMQLYSIKVFYASVYEHDILLEFHQIYNLGAVGGRDEMIRFWGRKVKG